MLSFLPLMNNSRTIGLNFLLGSISAIISSNAKNNFFDLLDYILVSFYKYHQLFVQNQ